MINNDNIVSANCPNCGASIVGSKLSPAIKCHWCQTIVPANLYNNNAKIPDFILPFNVTKDTAVTKMKEFISTKEKYINSDFFKSINYDNLLPVYLPYMMVDIKSHVNATGIGEKNLPFEKKLIQPSTYFVGTFNITEEFDLAIDNLIIESSLSGSFNPVNSSSNVISSVSPFDLENCVKFDVNYLNGFTSENRELDINAMNSSIPNITSEISEAILQKETFEYDRGIVWNTPRIDIQGTKWNSVYLPVWLYSYKRTIGNEVKTFYIAVNGRTEKTNGSISVDEKSLKSNNTGPIILTIFGIIMFLSIIGEIIMMTIIEGFETFFISNIVISIIVFLIVFIIVKEVSKTNRKAILEKLQGSFEKIDYANSTKYQSYNVSKSENKIEEHWTDDSYHKSKISSTIIINK